ncbi:SPOR domain-containing protein [Erythrobacter alti]|uniref:SPOR domain-containing protein n=1 Tax=Erythrobacter alti TaxID=1896145 RepID=UPI0030F3D954
MYATQKRNPMIGLGVTTAMTAMMLTGCASTPAPRADVSAAQAQQAIANGEQTLAIRAAEAAVTAEPRNAAHRMTLGNAYLNAGRFASAATSYEDAMALGNNSARAALSLALTLTGQARYAEASSLLNDWEGEIAASDLGLALALSGQPERGIHILSNAIRGGDNTVKSRQNLAYAYAVAGRWREARMMVAQDVPAHEVGDRMAEWAQHTHAGAYRARVASLLGVPANVHDNGQPVHLALANYPENPQFASEATALPVPAMPALAAAETERFSVPVTAGELPAVGSPAPTAPHSVAPQAAPRSAAPASFAEAFTAEPAPASIAPPSTPLVSSRYNAAPVVQPVPAMRHQAPAASPQTSVPARSAPAATAQAASAPAASAPQRRTSAAVTPAIARPALDTGAAPIDSGDGSHLVQLGSFTSEAGADRAWRIYVSRYPELANREKVITRAVVNGRNYWRVSAGGFDRSSSRAMCNRVDASNGDGCISWAAGSPLPGAIDTGVRLARR